MADTPATTLPEPPSETKTDRLRLHVVCGVVQSGAHFDVMSGCVLAASEDEARGNHARWMLGERPGYLIHSINVFPLPDDLVFQAAQELQHA